nr:MAG TPA: hypothetical protein [Caudoviricetes sp.]
MVTNSFKVITNPLRITFRGESYRELVFKFVMINGYWKGHIEMMSSSWGYQCPIFDSTRDLRKSLSELLEESLVYAQEMIDNHKPDKFITKAHKSIQSLIGLPDSEILKHVDYELW